jgi:hypothetical protein
MTPFSKYKALISLGWQSERTKLCGINVSSASEYKRISYISII